MVVLSNVGDSAAVSGSFSFLDYRLRHCNQPAIFEMMGQVTQLAAQFHFLPQQRNSLSIPSFNA